MKVLIAGDFAPRARLAKQIEEKKFEEIFSKDLRNIVKSADFSIINLESPVVEVGYKPIPKYGPNLHCISDAVEAIKFAGFTGVTMANNHIMDYGNDGLKKTIACCKANGLDIVGVGYTLKDAESVLYLKKNNATLAVINCCEHEFSIATKNGAGANPLNPIRQFYTIQEARKKANFVLVIVHGGHEYFQLPSPRMVDTYRFFIDIGADAVVNHHQHCYSGYEVYSGKPIFYGIGNFCFDTSPTSIDTIWNYGYMVEFTFSDSIEYKIYPFNQYSKIASIKLLDNQSFDKQLHKLNSIIEDKTELDNRVNEYFRQCEVGECSLLEPYSTKVMNKLYYLGLLPKFIRGKKAAAILNHLDCESHRDKLIYALKRKNK